MRVKIGQLINNTNISSIYFCANCAKPKEYNVDIKNIMEDIAKEGSSDYEKLYWLYNYFGGKYIAPGSRIWQ